MSGDEVLRLELSLQHHQQQMAGEHEMMRECLHRIEERQCEMNSLLLGDGKEAGLVERVRTVEATQATEAWWRRTILGAIVAVIGERLAGFFGWR